MTDPALLALARFLLREGNAVQVRREHTPVEGRCPRCRSSDTAAGNRGECSLFRAAGLALELG